MNEFLQKRAIASVTERIGIPGTTAPERSLTARLMGGLEFEVLPGRGLDIGDTFVRGIPLSWFSPVSDARALSAPSGPEWVSRFTGGLLVTCGLDNIGPATDTVGQHGTFSHLAADEVQYSTSVDETSHSVTISGTIDSVALFGPSFRVHRTITAVTTGEATELVVSDDVTNIGAEPAGLSLLYHVNFGAPLLAPGTRVAIESDGVATREEQRAVADWSTIPDVASTFVEAVFEHSNPVVVDGYASASVTNPANGMSVTVAWTADTLPRFYQWVFPTRGRWVLGIEPANAPMYGPDRTGEFSGAPVVLPGETRHHEVRITA